MMALTCACVLCWPGVERTQYGRQCCDLYALVRFQWAFLSAHVVTMLRMRARMQLLCDMQIYKALSVRFVNLRDCTHTRIIIYYLFYQRVRVPSTDLLCVEPVLTSAPHMIVWGGGVRGHWNCLPAIFTLFPLRPTFIDTHRCTHSHTHMRGCALVSRSLRVPIRVLPSICLTPFHYRSAAVRGAVSFAVRARTRVRLPSKHSRSAGPSRCPVEIARTHATLFCGTDESAATRWPRRKMRTYARVTRSIQLLSHIGQARRAPVT